MSPYTRHPLLERIVRTVKRRYRVPATPSRNENTQDSNPSDDLAWALETTRVAVASGLPPANGVKQSFLNALGRLVHDALHTDPAFQILMLQDQAASVRDFIRLQKHAQQDRRAVQSAVDAIAHPAKQRRAASNKLAAALAGLHKLMLSESWHQLADSAREATALQEVAHDTTLLQHVAQIPDLPSLQRLIRLHALQADQHVQRYLSLRKETGPRPGSTDAATQGTNSKQRGAAVETLATQALQALADRLNQTASLENPFQVVTSLRMPASLLKGAQRVKGEWDVVLLQKAEPNLTQEAASGSSWNICLLIEAKASADATGSDLPRLLRGLQLLAQAHSQSTYAFSTREGTVLLQGASLNALPTHPTSLKDTVLYCTNSAPDNTVRLLDPASRMQLLSAQPCLDYASALSTQATTAGLQILEPVWNELLTSAKWKNVLNQYAALHLARELTVHPNDLLVAIEQAAIT